MPHDFDAPPSSPLQEEEVTAIHATREAALPHQANSRFIFRYHPLRWMWVDDEHSAKGGEWLPQVGQRTIALGVNGVGADGDTAHAEAYDRRHQWRAIPLTCTEDDRSYLRRMRARGGYYHYTRWETPRWVGDEVLASDIDTAGYYAWLRWLVAEGHVPPISEDAKQRCSAQYAARARSIQRDVRSHPHLQSELDATKARLAAMRGTRPPKGKAQARGRGKAPTAEDVT